MIQDDEIKILKDKIAYYEGTGVVDAEHGHALEFLVPEGTEHITIASDHFNGVDLYRVTRSFRKSIISGTWKCTEVMITPVD